MNRFFCWLTGGHRYADINKCVTYDPIHRTFKVKNYSAKFCTKCGKTYTIDLSENILNMREVDNDPN